MLPTLIVVIVVRRRVEATGITKLFLTSNLPLRMLGGV